MEKTLKEELEQLKQELGTSKPPCRDICTAAGNRSSGLPSLRSLQATNTLATAMRTNNFFISVRINNVKVGKRNNMGNFLTLQNLTSQPQALLNGIL